MKQRRKLDRRALVVEGLEERRVLAASVGWDGPGAGSAQLSYYIGQSPNGISQSTFESAIETALKSWSDVANIKFVQTTQPGLNNSLDFTSKRIDGSGGTLAQAYFPSDVNRSRLAGDVEFDSGDKWEVGNSLGNAAFDLVLVAAHEIGHALGLDHSNKTSAILYPSVSPSQSFKGLDSADVSAIRSLYAAAPGSTNTNPSNTGTTNTNTGTTNTGTTNTGTTRTPRFTFNSWFANWHSRFGRLNSGLEQLDSTIPTNQNLSNPLDVNIDDSVSPVDALIVINILNDRNQLTIETNYKSDTNGDGQVSPIDALIVINGLNDRSGTTVITIDASGQGPLITIQTEPADSVDSDGTTTTDTSDTGDDTTVDDATPDDSTTDDSDTGTDTDIDDSTDHDEPHDHPHHFGHFGSGGFGFGLPIAFGGILTPKQVESLFDRLDENADELLTEDEVPSRLWTRWVEDSVDTNDDSAISVAEVNAAVRAKQQEKFDALDDDSNGLLVESEVSSRMWKKLTDAKADTNADGAISFDELTAFQSTRSGFASHLPILLGGALTPERVDRLFTKFDENADDLLTEDEVPTLLWTRWVEDGVDTNDDSSISVDEVNAAIRAKQQEKFDAIDTNSDGLLSETEVSAREWQKLTDADADTDADGGISFDELLAYQSTASADSDCDHSETNGTDSNSNSAITLINTLRHSGFATQVANALRNLARRFRG